MKTGRSAFTLLELLVAMAVLALFVTLAFQITTGALNQWQAVNSKLKLNMQARMVLDWIERDLQTALVRQDGGEWLRIEPYELEAVGTLKFPATKLMLFSQAGERHVDPDNTVTSDEDPATLSGPAAVAYDMAYVDPLTLAPTRPRPGLFRLALDPGYTFLKGFVENTPENLRTDLWDVLPQDIGVIRPEHLLVENVCAFRIRVEFADAAGSIRTTAEDDTFSAGANGEIRTGTGGGAQTYPGAKVLSVEVTLWLLDMGGTNRLRQIEAGGGEIPLDELLERYAHPFTRKISLQAP